MEGIFIDTVSDVGLTVKSYEKDDLKTIFGQWLNLTCRVYNSLDEDSVIEMLSRLMAADVVNKPPGCECDRDELASSYSVGRTGVQKMAAIP